MGFRFWRRVRVAPGITLNLSKGGLSVSAGPRGAKMTVGKRGVRATAGLPGTGLFYTKEIGASRAGTRGRASNAARQSEPQICEQLTLTAMKRLVTPAEECAFVDGCRLLLEQRETDALDTLRGATGLSDGAFLAGFLALKRNLPEEAEHLLKKACSGKGRLGAYFSKYQLAPTVYLPVTEHISAWINVDRRGVLLALVEVYQLRKRGEDAIACLKELRRSHPDDALIKLSLAELLLDLHGQEKRVWLYVDKLLAHTQNESEVHGAMLLFRARALRHLGMHKAACDILTGALRRTAGRPDDLLHALRYERVLVYEALGQRSRMRADLERLYAVAPAYEDVSKRLGIHC